MEPTKDMIEEARNAAMRRSIDVPSGVVRSMLTAALADVPEPAKDLALVRDKPSYAELDGHFRDACRTLAEQNARIAELEAKLASVRALADELDGKARQVAERAFARLPGNRYLEPLLEITMGIVRICAAQLRERVEGT